MNAEIGADIRRFGRHPSIHEASHRLERAQVRLNDARGVLEVLESQQERHEQEAARLAEDGRPIITNEEALAKDSGGGYAIQYR